MSLVRFASYDDYLDERISETDMRYLGDRSMARELIGQHGQHPSGGTSDAAADADAILGRREFELRGEKELQEEERKSSSGQGSASLSSVDGGHGHREHLLSAFLQRDSEDDDPDCPALSSEGGGLLRAVAEREESMREGTLTPIVFVRRKDEKTGSGSSREVSAFVDLAQRMKEGSVALIDSRDCRGASTGEDQTRNDDKRRTRLQLLPRRGDLSFYDWRAGGASASAADSSSSSNFEVVILGGSGGADPELAFKSKLDGSTLRVDPFVLLPISVSCGGVRPKCQKLSTLLVLSIATLGRKKRKKKLHFLQRFSLCSIGEKGRRELSRMGGLRGARQCLTGSLSLGMEGRLFPM